jgi:hypothetical protein
MALSPMKKQLIGIALILLGILFGIANEILYGYATIVTGVFLGIIGLIIVVAYAIDKRDR